MHKDSHQILDLVSMFQPITLKQAIAQDTVVIIDCPVDYAENMKLTATLKEMKSPL